MKRHQLKLLCLLLACLLTLQLAGCAAGNPAGPGTDPGGTADDPQHTGRTPVPAQPVNLMAGLTPDPAAPASMTAEASCAAADFALRLFRAGYNPEQNTLISPLSVLCALAMTANGAKGETLAQMESTLGLPRDLWNAYFRAYMDSLSGDDTLKLANSVWFTADPRFTVNRDFLQTNADYYGADAYQAPFDDSTLEAINAWVNDKTDGMIPQILDSIPQAAVMYLINALAFDAKWASPYTKYAVQQGTFTCADGSKRQVDFMYAEESDYLESDTATGFLKPYAGGKYAFAALLPKAGVSLEDCLASLDGASLQALLSAPQSIPTYTALPKFEAEYGVELSEILKRMGMELPFHDTQADLSGLGTSSAGNLFVSRVLHKTFISVDEAGTRAGAATAVEVCDEAAAMETRQVYLDRPFIYMLIDTETNLPFFIGTMLDPAN